MFFRVNAIPTKDGICLYASGIFQHIYRVHPYRMYPAGMDEGSSTECQNKKPGATYRYFTHESQEAWQQLGNPKIIAGTDSIPVHGGTQKLQ